VAANGLSALTSSLINTLIGGVLTTPSGASFWDAGTLSPRLYGGVGIRLLGVLDLSGVFSNPGLLKYGDLNLVGLLNPLRTVPASRLMYGEVATWAQDDDHIIWGSDIYSPDGDHIIWGTSDDDDHIIWGSDVTTSPEAR
jgi:hypothetical protein